jgi:hypothetical protein
LEARRPQVLTAIFPTGINELERPSGVKSDPHASGQSELMEVRRAAMQIDLSFESIAY